jgi:hypothetical protein
MACEEMARMVVGTALLRGQGRLAPLQSRFLEEINRNMSALMYHGN